MTLQNIREQVRLRRPDWSDFKLVSAAAVVLLVLVAGEGLFWPLVPLRLVLGLVFVLVVPGYCLLAALFPRRGDLDGIARVGLSFGLSVALMPLLVLLLDRTPWGIRTWPILLGVYGETALFAAAAVWQRALLPSKEAFALHSHVPASSQWWSLSPSRRHRYASLVVVAAGLLCIGALWVWEAREPRMTEFFMLGEGGLAERYPSEAAIGESIGVIVGINNHEAQTHSFRVEVWASDPWASERRALVAQHGPVQVARGASWEMPIAWRMPWAGENQQVVVLLFAGDDAQPYRQLKLWMNVTAPS